MIYIYLQIHRACGTRFEEAGEFEKGVESFEKVNLFHLIFIFKIFWEPNMLFLLHWALLFTNKKLVILLLPLFPLETFEKVTNIDM